MITKILAVIGGIIVLILVVALFVRDHYVVKRDVLIKAPSGRVFDYIKYTKNQDHYSKWNMMDPNSKKDYKGTDGNPGFIYYWDSSKKDVGKGEQETKSVVDGKQIDFEIRFIKPFAGVAQSSMITDAVDLNTTRVTWTFATKMPYPMNVVMLFINMDDVLGKDLDVGLNNLKSILEK